jgi:ribosome-associated heat shock protein Hsp15
VTDASLRLDRWLWFARFLKSRTLAAKLCAAGHVRLNHRVIDKASAAVKPGDVLTFPLGRAIRVVRVAQLGTRRGPPGEAALLYEDLTPPSEPLLETPAVRPRGGGRPTKAERRAMAVLTGRP